MKQPKYFDCQSIYLPSYYTAGSAFTIHQVRVPLICPKLLSGLQVFPDPVIDRFFLRRKVIGKII